VPPFVKYCAHTFSASGDIQVSQGIQMPFNTTIFLCGVENVWKKQILARATRIQKENWGNQAFFRDN